MIRLRWPATARHRMASVPLLIAWRPGLGLLPIRSTSLISLHTTALLSVLDKQHTSLLPLNAPRPDTQQLPGLPSNPELDSDPTGQRLRNAIFQQDTEMVMALWPSWVTRITQQHPCIDDTRAAQMLTWCYTSKGYHLFVQVLDDLWQFGWVSPPPPWTLTQAFLVYYHHNDYARASKLFQTLENGGVERPWAVYRIMARLHIQRGRLRDTRSVLKQLNHLGGTVDVATWVWLVQWCTYHRIEVGLQWVENRAYRSRRSLAVLSPVFRALISAYTALMLPDALHNLWMRVKDRAADLDDGTLSLFLRLCAAEDRPELAALVLATIHTRPLSTDPELWGAVVTVYCQCKPCMADAVALLASLAPTLQTCAIGHARQLLVAMNGTDQLTRTQMRQLRRLDTALHCSPNSLVDVATVAH